VEEQDFAGHVHGIAGEELVEQSFVHAEVPRRVTSAAGMEIRCRDVRSPRSAAVIVVPGAGYGDGSGLHREVRRGVLPRALAAAPGKGLVLGAVSQGVHAGIDSAARLVAHPPGRGRARAVRREFPRAPAPPRPADEPLAHGNPCRPLADRSERDNL
jgi:hypothetical protein